MLTVDGGSTATYIYDASGQRVEETLYGGAPIDFIYDQQGHVVTEATASSWMRSELYAGNQHVGLYANGTTYFMHTDWLGSTKNQSDMSGNSAQWCSYLPFGDGFSCPGSQLDLMNFTGDQWDGQTGLSHTLFRQYNPAPGRWMTPDPAGMAAADPTNPQSWNRYAYVMNNPLAIVDPLGLVDCMDDSSNPICRSDAHGGIPCTGNWVAYGNGEMCVDTVVFNGMCLPSVGVQGMWLGVNCGGGIPNIIIAGPSSSGNATPANNIGTIRSVSRLQCAAIQANDSSLPSIAGISDDTYLGKAAHLFGDNVFSGIYDFGHTVATASNAAPVYTQLALNGTRMGLPGGGTISKGLVGVAQDNIFKYAFENLSKAAAEELIDDITGVKLAYDGATFLYGLYQCH